MNPITAATTAILAVLATLVVLVWAVLAISTLAAGTALISAGNTLRHRRGPRRCPQAPGNKAVTRQECLP